MSRRPSSMQNYLTTYGILDPSHTSVAAEILLSIQPDIDSYPYTTPSKYIGSLWEKVEQHRKFTATLRGKAFELIIACALIKEGIIPFYWQASLEFVPLANYDLLIYSKEIGPIALSCKTSLRERYKQAEFEALALKNVHRRAKTFLLTMEAHEAQGVNEKIKSGILSGIDRAVVANRVDFNRLIDEIKSLTVVEAPTISIVATGNLIE